jgi:hypothetical protein
MVPIVGYHVDCRFDHLDRSRVDSLAQRAVPNGDGTARRWRRERGACTM